MTNDSSQIKLYLNTQILTFETIEKIIDMVISTPIKKVN